MYNFLIDQLTFPQGHIFQALSDPMEVILNHVFNRLFQVLLIASKRAYD
jgi:hypothetical protein